MTKDKTVRTHQTLKDVKMNILGDVRTIAEVKVSYDVDGRMYLSFDEHNRIADEIHQALRRQRRVYHGND